ncbi:MAG: CDP-alcohol phosphatidyltransferase family protein [Clostridia bacterium]|nr:CDP-alcohol phosphatidyltransferase family protein [Clostridia bacterium]
MANIITGLRIPVSLALLFFPAFSAPFTVLYLIAGISDMVDGIVARRTDTASELGARLDTAADFAFVVVCLIRLLPVINIPAWLCVWTGAIALIKGINAVSGVVKQKRFVAVHSIMNKITGALLFVFPLTLPLVEMRFTAPVVCATATFAAIQEGHLIRKTVSGGKTV